MAQDEIEVGQRGAEAAFLRGVGYARIKQWQQAIRALSAALEEDRGHVEAHLELARCQAQVGQTREAVRLIDRALGLPRLDDGMRVRLLGLLGRVSVQGGDYARASEAFEEVMEITGGAGGPILNQLGQVMCKSGNFERGFALFARAMRQK